MSTNTEQMHGQLLHIESLCITENKMGFLSSSIYVSATVGTHNLDVNETHGEELDRNYTRMLRVDLNKSGTQQATK